MIDIGPGCFSDEEKTVISFEGNNFYRACDEFVAGHADGSMSYCVKRVGHPGDVHEDFDGVLNSKSFRLDDPSPQDGFGGGEKGDTAKMADLRTNIFDRVTINGVEQDDTSRDEFVKRHIAWERAKEIVDSAVDKFGLKEQVTRPGGFAIGYVSTDTEVDQYLDHIESVANWLLGISD